MSETTKASRERLSKVALKKILVQKRRQATSRSERYEKLVKAIPAEPVAIGEAIALAKRLATVKFDSSVELHLHLHPKKGKKGTEDELARGIVDLPHGLGKVRRVVILDEARIEALEKKGLIDFDVAVATPQTMPKLAKIAKLLGTKGKMPSPKAGTVTDDPQTVKAAYESGRVEWRQDAGGNIHQMIGKVSWDDDKLVDNAQAVLKAIAANRLASVSVATTMGPSVRVKV